MWDLLVQDWGVQNWTKGGNGTAEISPAGQLHLLRNAVVTDDIYVWKDFGTLPDDYTAEFRCCVDDYKIAGRMAHQFYDGVHRCEFDVYVDKVKNPDSGTSIGCTNTAGVWYTWRVVIDSSSHIMRVFRDGVYLGDLGGGLNYVAGDGTVYSEMGPSATINAEMHEEYFYIGSGLIDVDKKRVLVGVGL